MVDDEDYPLLSKFKWCVAFHRSKHKVRIYAKRAIEPDGKHVTVLMHRQIMGCAEDVDHADHNGLNNQRYNLRPSSQAQNNANSRKLPGTSSRFRGVSYCAARDNYLACISRDHKTYNLGRCRDEVDAATIYNFKAFEFFGQFATYNLPSTNAL